MFPRQFVFPYIPCTTKHLLLPKAIKENLPALYSTENIPTADQSQRCPMGCERIYSDQTLTFGVHSLSMGQGTRVSPCVCSGLCGFEVLTVNHLVGGSSPSRGAKLNKALRPFNAPRLKLLYQFCTSALHHPGARQSLGVLRQVIGR